MCDSFRPHTAAHQATLSFTISQSLLKFMSIESVMLSISYSASLFSFCLQSFPASGSFPVNQVFTSGCQTTGTSASALVLPMNIQGWFPLRLTDLISLLSQGTLKRLLQHHSLEALILWCSAFFMVQLTSVHNYWKNHSFDYTDLCQQIVISAF